MANDWINRPLPDLDLYLARAFIPYPAIWATLAANGADRERAETTWMRILEAKLPRNIAAYSEVFGAPSGERDGSYVWPLTLWPDHEFLLAFHDNLQHLGPRAPLRVREIARRVPGQPERVSPLSIDGALRALRLGYDTTAEVQVSLGDCERYDGWSPWDSWEYDVPDGSVLQCVFSHNILVEITPERLHDPISRRTHPLPTDPTSS
jgi:hypothetical protein